MTIAKLGCTPAIWLRAAHKASLAAGVDPGRVLAGDKALAYRTARWAAWYELVGRGFSYASIGRASGFNHTSVLNACCKRYRSRKYNIPDAEWDHDPRPPRDWMMVVSEPAE